MSSDREDPSSADDVAPEASRPVFFIGVVAELTGTHPQTLRNYERMGLLRPGRSQGSVRMFSSRDVERVRRIRRLTQDLGVNLAGVEVILNLTEKMEQVHAEHERALAEIENRHRAEVQRLKEMLQRVTR
jgi:MerR family transcriptional regulator, heat shock protein HspR